MNFRKMFLVTVLAVSQLAAAVPAFAAPVSTQTVTGHVAAAVDTSETQLQPESTDPLPPLMTEPPAGTVVPTPTPVPTASPVQGIPAITETPAPAATEVPGATAAPVDGTVPTDAVVPTATPLTDTPVTPSMTTTSTLQGQASLF